MEERNQQTKPLPKITNSIKGSGLEDTELFKVEQALELLKSLFTSDNEDRELEISDLRESDVSDISKLKYFDRVLGFSVYGDLVKDYLRGMFSKDRKSRGEVLQAIESLFLEAKSIDNEGMQKKHKLKKSLNNFVDSFK